MDFISMFYSIINFMWINCTKYRQYFNDRISIYLSWFTNKTTLQFNKMNINRGEFWFNTHNNKILYEIVTVYYKGTTQSSCICRIWNRTGDGIYITFHNNVMKLIVENEQFWKKLELKDSNW